MSRQGLICGPDAHSLETQAFDAVAGFFDSLRRFKDKLPRLNTWYCMRLLA